jgi:hypothetical protein
MATTLASGSRFDLVMVQGATFEKAFEYKDSTKTSINLTGYTARLQVRSDTDASTTLIELTTENNRITLNDPTTGVIQLYISAADTAALTFNTGVYDLELQHVASGRTIVENIVYGNVSLRKNVTR